MRVTVCQLDPDRGGDWAGLCAHTAESGPDLVLLPEMPFGPWLPGTREVDPTAWDRAVRDHEDAEERFAELGAPVVLSTRPITDAGRRLHEALVWEAGAGLRGVHRKAYLPDEPGFWEASWYERGPVSFDAFDTAAARAGFLMCSELWFGEHARGYARAGTELVACPRATDAKNTDKWLAAGRVAAISAGAYCLSSNRAGVSGEARFGGTGWVIDPGGQILARTSADQPFVTAEVDLEVARAAKHTYPRYIRECVD